MTVSSVNPFKPKEEQDQKTKKPTVTQPQDINIYGNAATAKTPATDNNGNITFVNQQTLDDDADIGLSIQRTTQPQPATTTTPAPAVTTDANQRIKKSDDLLNRSADDPVWKQNAENNKKNGKPGFNQTLEKFYGKKFTEASPEEKEKLAVKYFDWIRSDKKGKISQSRQFELYKQRCESPEEYEFLCSVIDKMESGEQAKAAQSVMYDGSDSQKLIGTRAVARDIDNYSQEDIAEIKKLFYGEDFENLSPKEKRERRAILESEMETWKAEHPDEEHTDLAFITYKVNMNISRDKAIPEEERKDAGVKAQSYTQYAHVEDQPELIDEGYNSDISEVREETARQSHTYDKTVQKYAVDRGLSLQDENIANILAKNAYNYDESVRDDIINTLNNSGYDSVKNTLREAKAQYEAEQQSKAETSRNSEETTSRQTTTGSSESASALAQSERRISNIVNNNTLNTTQKAKQIKGLTPKEQSVAIGKMISTATLPEIKSLALSGLKSEVMNYLFNNYSPENSSMLESLSDIMTADEKHHFEKLKAQHTQNQPVTNFFIH